MCTYKCLHVQNVNIVTYSTNPTGLIEYGRVHSSVVYATGEKYLAAKYFFLYFKLRINVRHK